MKYLYYKAINWNEVEDEIDVNVWEKLSSYFWLDTRIPVSNDLTDWQSLPQKEKGIINKVLGGLALLATLQSEKGAVVIRKDVRTQQEEAILNNIVFMESVHAKSYSTILTSLNTPEEIDKAFKWINDSKYLQYKTNRINEIYQNGTPLQKKIANVFLGSFLSYSGFFTPLWYLGNHKFSNVAKIIKLIIRDESVYSTYLGYKFQLDYRELSEEQQRELRAWMYTLLEDLMDNELKYIEEIYDQIDWMAEVKTFVRYSANRVLQDLGFESYYSNAEANDVNPIIMNSILTETTNHDFFSQAGSSYLKNKTEAMTEDDYDFL